MKKIIFILILVFLIPSGAWAACTGSSPTWSSTADRTSVASCVSQAADGDTINVAAGSATWYPAISWTDKNISVIGAGVGVTVISTGGRAFDVTASTKASFRISGMTIQRTAGQFAVYINSYYATAPIKGWRVDHIAFTNVDQAIHIEGVSWGVIDHCTFTSSGMIISTSVYAQAVGDSLTDVKGAGGRSWDWPLNLGTDEAVYFEDCTFTMTSSLSSVSDLNYGARVVFRHNTVNNTGYLTHSTRGNERGSLKSEIYDNVFTATTAGSWIGIRSGTGVVFNNAVSGYGNNDIFVDFQRRVECGDMTGAQYYSCNGTRAWDGNVEANGWPCLDQPGRGPGTIGAQPSVPIYAWSNGPSVNNLDGSRHIVVNPGCSGLSPWLKSTVHSNGEVDFVNNGTTAKPGYTAYTYPHPLTGDNPPPVNPDQTPPVISNPIPSGEQPCNPATLSWQGNFGVTTDEAATCRVSVPDVPYDDMPLTFTTTGGTTHTYATEKDCGTNFTLKARCVDTHGNRSAASTDIVILVAAAEGPADTTPPVISGASPSGTIACSPVTKTISFTTDEAAVGKYGLTDAAYASLTSVMSSTGGLTHTQDVTATCNTTVTYYVGAQDGAGNPTAANTAITVTTSGDATAPVAYFGLPGAHVGFSVVPDWFTGSDNVAVTGYIITASDTPPDAGGAGWSATPQTSYTTAGPGSMTLYGWTKDEAENVSAASSDDTVRTGSMTTQ